MSTIYCKYDVSWNVEESVDSILQLIKESNDFITVSRLMGKGVKKLAISIDNIISIIEN